MSNEERASPLDLLRAGVTQGKQRVQVHNLKNEQSQLDKRRRQAVVELGEQVWQQRVKHPDYSPTFAQLVKLEQQRTGLQSQLDELLTTISQQERLKGQLNEGFAARIDSVQAQKRATVARLSKVMSRKQAASQRLGEGQEPNTAEIERLNGEQQAIQSEISQYESEITAIQDEQARTIRPIEEQLSQLQKQVRTIKEQVTALVSQMKPIMPVLGERVLTVRPEAAQLAEPYQQIDAYDRQLAQKAEQIATLEQQITTASPTAKRVFYLLVGTAGTLALLLLLVFCVLIRSIGSFVEPSVKTYRSEVHGFGFDYPKDWVLAEAPFMIHVGTSSRAVYTNLDTTHGEQGELVVNIARAKNGFIPNLNADNPNDAMDHLLRAGGQDTKEGFSEPVQKIINNKQTVYFTVERPQKEKLLVLFTEVGEELFFMSAVSSFERAFEEDEMAILDIVASLELTEPNDAEGASNTTFNSEIFNLRLDLPAGWIAAHEGDLLFNLARSLDGLQSVGKEPVNPSEVAAIFRVVPLAAPDFCGSLEPTAHSVLNDFVSSAQHFEELSEIYEVNANSKQVMAIKVRNTNLDVNMLLISAELDDAIALFITHVGANAPAEYESELYSIAASMEYSGSAVLSELSGIVEPNVSLDERFTSVLGGISFDHPSDWEAKDTSSPTMLLNFSFGSVASLSSPGEFGTIVLTPTKLDTTFSEGVDWGSALGIELGINLVSLLGTSERSTVTVNGTCLHVMDGTTFNGAGMYIVVAQLEDGRSVAFITATGPGQADTLEPYKETLLAIVSTVR